jgi:hypothetical protein
MLGKFWNPYTSTAIAIFLIDNSDFEMFCEGLLPKYVTRTVSVTEFLSINYHLVFRIEYNVSETEFTEED